MKISTFAAAAARAVALARIALYGLLLATPLTVLAAFEVVKVATPGALSVSHAWARATPPGVAVGGAYFTIVNDSDHSDTLVSLSSPAAAAVELHRTTFEHGLSRMRPAGQIVITPGQTVKAEPGGLHVMLTGLKSPLAEGQRVPLVLIFQQAGAITVQVHVLSTASAAPTGHPAHAGR